MDKRILRLLVVFFAVIFAAFSFRMWQAARFVSADSGSRQVMGTIGRIVAVASDKQTAELCIESAFNELSRLEGIMSSYNESSQLSAVNRDAFAGPVKVGGELFEVLEKSIEYNKKSGGAFDITIGPVVRLWQQAGESKKKPTAEQLVEARSKVGSEKLLLDAENKTVRFAVKGMRLDLGGIAKGWAIDSAVEAMRKNGAVGGMVDVGGDIRCFGTAKKAKGHWRIGLQDPSAEGKMLMVLKLTDMAVATSGDYRRFVLIDEQKYSHIVSPKSGSPGGQLASVTIIAPTAVQADALATAVSVMGGEKGLELAESIPNVEAILISSGPQQIRSHTKGAEQYISD